MKAVLLAACASFLLSGCAAVAVADLAVGAAVGAVKLTGAVVGAAVDLVIPDGDKDEKKK